jgi:hypothetical protein
MPKVTLPLGSAKAYGQMGKMMVFQGESVRAYVVPNDRQTSAQVAARSFFSDFTKTLRTAGLLARGAFKNRLGSRWFTSFYKLARDNENARWVAADTIYNAFSVAQKAAWLGVAPFSSVGLDAGRVFFNMTRLYYIWQDSQESIFFGMPFPEGGNASDVRAWWDKDYSDVLVAGVYSDDATQLKFHGTWTKVTDAGAAGGSFRKSGGTFSDYLDFFFVGRRAIVKYVKDADLGGMSIDYEGGWIDGVEVKSPIRTFANYFDSGLLSKGLHVLSVMPWGLGRIAVDGVEIKNK